MITKIILGFAYLVMFTAWISLIVSAFLYGQPPYVDAFAFLVIFGYLLYPCKHPCDYDSYAEWWADRNNWFKK